MAFSFTELKQFTVNNLILNSIQIASIKAASEFDLTSSLQGLKNLVGKILNNPEDTEWCKAISFYVVINNPTVEWDRFQENITTIESGLVEKCKVAIEKLGV